MPPAGLTPDLVKALLNAQPGGAAQQQQQAPPPQQMAPPPPDPSAAPGGYGADAGMGVDPVEQIIWSAFPGTDPQVAGQTAQQGGMPALYDLFGSDRAKLAKMHQDQLEALIGQLRPPEPAPEVGGEGIGF